CEALLMRPDIILLDNMTPAQIRQLVRMRNKSCDPKHRPLLEISGGVTLKNINRYVRLGVERISIGALTHSVMAADVAMKITWIVNRRS
ncbi:MAG TPA: nicotinate-nucleotide diphosphorylase (carboxylating), partial [bacterium]|nr:nicotinate-nucleotide diphosphorylase (carboxylating) [bacterium]